MNEDEQVALPVLVGEWREAQVDTAALAVHMQCAPAFVLRLVRLGILTPVGKVRTARIGRPSHAFDLDEADAAVKAAIESGRVELDQGTWRVRK